MFSLVDQYGNSFNEGIIDYQVCPVSVFTAHNPQPDRHDNRFGQLGKQLVINKIMCLITNNNFY